MPRAIVTGANGHVGAHLIRELLARGYEIVAFVRRSSDLTGLEGLDIELRYGDVLDADSLLAAAEGCDVMFHTAAVYRTWARSADEVMAPALEGTRNAFAAAREHAIGRIVYTSSVVAIGNAHSPDAPRSGKDWNDDPSSVYYRAKTESEREAHRLAEETGIELVAVCPGVVLGSLDYRITPSTDIVRGVVNRTMFTWNGGINVVSAADVARVHALAAEKGVPGHRYPAGGANLTVRELGARLREMTGVKPRHLGGPRWLSYVLAAIMELGARIVGKQPMATRALARDMSGRYGYLDIEETRALGFEPTPLDAVLDETLCWLVHLGELRPRVARNLGDRFRPQAGWLPRRSEPAQLEP
jgi:dihydroflavonol-4-reductase